MKLATSLCFDGTCEEAFRLYERVFGGTIVTLLTYEQSPTRDHVPSHWRSKIFHATLTVGESVLMGGDFEPERLTRPQGFSIVMTVDGPADADRIFDALVQSGAASSPMQQTFWASRFGVVRDKYGITWTIQCE